MPRSKKVEARVPWPLVENVEDQIEDFLPYENMAQCQTSFFLWQSMYGTSHPVTSGYFNLSLKKRDQIDDFLRSENLAGNVKRGQLVKRLAQEANITGEESFTEHGEKIFTALVKLATDYAKGN